MLRVPRRYQPPSPAHVCVGSATARRGEVRRAVARRGEASGVTSPPVHRHYSPRVPREPGTGRTGGQSYREPQSIRPLNNNHDWIPRGFGGRTFRSTSPPLAPSPFTSEERKKESARARVKSPIKSARLRALGRSNPPDSSRYILRMSDDPSGVQLRWTKSNG